MTFQWTAVAIFLYGEIGVILVFCLPFISPLRWQKIFMIPLWSKMAVFWNKMFLTIIVLLIVLFLDAFREVRKYSSIHVNEKTANVNTNAFDHIQMKLFRSQRNLYLSGFSLFLWLYLVVRCRKDGASSSQWIHTGMTRGNREGTWEILTCGKKYFFYYQEQRNTGTRALKSNGISIMGHGGNSTGQAPEQSAQPVPALSRSLDRMTSGNPFQPTGFYDSVLVMMFYWVLTAASIS